MKTALLVSILAIAVFGKHWDSYNEPTLFSESYDYSLKNLPTQGHLRKTPWSDTYWPSYQSGIAHRWNSRSPQDFDYKLYTAEELKQMSTRQLMELSPAEKYDIFVGRYDYPMVHSEWKRTSPNDETWEGLCHGWAPASLHYDQPEPVSLKNKDGITVPFGSSDIKALLIYFVAEYAEEGPDDTHFVGQRCKYDLKENPSYENQPACADINAGTFHIIIANQIGNLDTGFVVDRDRSIQVWNQPVCAFGSRILSENAPSAGASANAAKEIEVETTMVYTKETAPAWKAHEPYLIKEQYTYRLEVDAKNNIVGGTQESWDRPDFQWTKKVSDFKGYFSTLEKIYMASVDNGTAVPEARVLSNHMGYRNPTLLTSASADFTSHGSVSGGYLNSQHNVWVIAPTPAPKSVAIKFNSFATERYHDKVKIYEGTNGDGALVAVLHGTTIPEDITVNGEGATIVFVTDESVTDSGFHATYTANY